MRAKRGLLGRDLSPRGVPGPKRPVITRKESRGKSTPSPSSGAAAKRPCVPVKMGRNKVAVQGAVKTIYFCHFPKTGGTFTANVFKRLNLQEKYRFVVLQHGTNYSQYKGPNSILIANVRKPSEVVQSLYSHGQDGFLNVIKKHSLRSFDDFWQHFTKFQIPEYCRIFCQGMLYRYALTAQGKPYFDYVLRNETLEEDMRRVFDDLGICYTDDVFDLTSTERNLYLHTDLEDNVGYNKRHKYERLNTKLMDVEKEAVLRKLFGQYYQAYGY